MVDHLEDQALLDWLTFIKTDNDEVVKVLSEKNKDIHRAKKKLEELSSDDEIRRVADNRAKYLSDYETDRRGAFEEGRQEGRQEGCLDGKVIKQKNTLHKFLNRLDIKNDEKIKIADAINTIDDLDKLIELEDLFFDMKIEDIYKLLNVESST